LHEPALVLSRELRVRAANRPFLETFHISAEETLNRPMVEVGNGQWNFPQVHRLLHFMLRNSGARLKDVPVEHDFERIGHKAFQINACHLNGGPANPILFALHEVRSEPRYCHLFETARDGILIVDAESEQITDANRFMTDLLGLEREQLIGMRCWEVESLTGTPLGREGFDRVRAEGLVRFPSLTLQTSHGTSIEAEVVGNIVEEAGCQSVQFNLRDITERRQCDRQSWSEAKQESLGVFAGGMAHDFNNLLAIIMGNTSLVLSDAPKESPYRNALNAVIRASQRGADLTRQMLTYSGETRFVLRHLDLSEIVRETSSVVGRSLPNLIELEVDLSADSLFIYADADQMKQLITNLVINGAEAFGEGETGYVRVTTRQTVPEEERILNVAGGETSGTWVVLEVEDSGSGMDAATQARIFDPFFSTKFTGRGLGLAAALGIVKGHGGSIAVESRSGGGTTVRISLPTASTSVAQLVACSQ
jgi:PAS domain S-box-containing protein